VSWGARNAGSSRTGIAILVLVMYGSAIAIQAYVAVPPGNESGLNQLLGGLNNALGVVVGFFFNVQRRQDVGP